MFDRFTDRAWKVMAFARHAADRYNHEYIGTEHILLGMLDAGFGSALQILQRLGCHEFAMIRQELHKHMEPGVPIVRCGALPFTPRAKHMLELAVEEASNLGHNYIGTEHLLLGIIKEHDGLAAQVLFTILREEFTLKNVREETLGFLGADLPQSREDSSSAMTCERFRRILEHIPIEEVEMLDNTTSDAWMWHSTHCDACQKLLSDASQEIAKLLEGVTYKRSSMALLRNMPAVVQKVMRRIQEKQK